MRVSVIICTLDRANALGATLECLQHQHHDDFEVIVVNGPSTDNTAQVLAPWMDRIRYRENPERNLSISRNIGIRASTGELLAFIDDDALPEPEWLTQAIPAFDDAEVAGAGGIVFDHTGFALQYRYSATDRLCRAVKSEHDFARQCFPGTFQFPYLQGTNQIYRRRPLLAVGGFDENIFFYGDDADICGRLIDAGWLIRQLPTSAVHHKFLPSHIRDHQRITTNWFPVVHDHTYFALRHASAYMAQDEILNSIHEFIEGRVGDTKWHEDAGRLPPGTIVGARATCMRGFADGLAVGLGAIGKDLPPLITDDAEFLRFPTLGGPGRRKLVFVSNYYTGNLEGGIARFISDLAPAMAARGHDVRVITRATGPAAVDFEDGVWVHRVEVPSLANGEGVVADVLPAINSFATAALTEIQRIRAWAEPDLVYTPLWDIEGIGILRHTDLPVALHIATPHAVAGAMAGFLRNDGSYPSELRRLLELESEVLDAADILHANSTAVIETIRSTCGVECDDRRWQLVNLGLKDRSDVRPRDVCPTDQRRVYFAGRFERRKGIDVLLEAMARILADHPDVELVIAGEDRPLEPGLPLTGKRWLAEHAHEPWIARVTMLGVVDDERLHREYADAEIVVLPSRYESFGLAMVEAMMHGKPLVATDTSGVREVVRNGVDGVLVAPGDVDELERAIRRLLDDRNLAAELGKAARERFEQHLSIEACAERFEPMCQRVATVCRRPGEEPHRIPLVMTADDLARCATATLVIRADGVTRVRIVDRSERVIDLADGERRRIHLDTTADRSSFTTERGTALVERVITIAEAPSER
jgi:glycosyltransferase involved in cell wall biosynthesis